MKGQQKTSQRSSKLVVSEAEAFTSSLKHESKRSLSHERKKRSLERSSHRIKRGLKNATKSVFEYLKKQDEPVSLKDIIECMGEQHSKRRAYDILNVLHAANVITHNKKDIMLVSTKKEARRKRRKKNKDVSEVLEQPILIYDFPVKAWDEGCDPLEILLDSNSASVSPTSSPIKRKSLL